MAKIVALHSGNKHMKGEPLPHIFVIQVTERVSTMNILMKRESKSNLSLHIFGLAFFGKYLNEYNGSYIPPGWSDWSALVRNSRYYNYTLNVNGDLVHHGANYKMDYYPDLIVNDSLQYMRYSKRSHSSKPYLMVMSFPSPHGPEDAAPEYQQMFLNEKSHR